MSFSDSELRDLEQLYLYYSKRLYRLAYKWLYNMTGNAADASDIVQAVFVIAARRWDEVKSHDNPGGWLVKATEYTCLNYFKAHSKRKNINRYNIEQLLSHQPHSYGKLYTGAADDEHSAQNMLFALEQVLSKEDYAILKAFCLDNLAVSEISLQTGLSENAIRVRIHRLRNRLKNIFVTLVTFLTFQNI